ncbi:MAG: serine/threonine protein kinase, partial [Leptolyngbyaceae cyanobacterium bins.302]|nr:serine/threonine protein kinase [Leptolyngbyaceae cyanobacterium bins.302]
VAPPPPIQPTQPQPASTLSQMNTVAVGRRPDPPQPASPPPATNRPPTIETPRSSIWDDPLAIIAAGIGLVILTGLGSWLLMRAILGNQQSEPTPITTPTPPPTPTFPPTPTPTTTPTSTPQSPGPVNYTKRLNLNPNRAVTQSGVLKSNETMTYIVSADQGQSMQAVLSGDGVLMSIYGPDNRPLDDNARRVSFWQGTLPYDGDYFIELRPVRGLDSGNYEIDISLRSQPTPEPTPSPPTPPPQTSINEIPVNFPPGDNTQSFSDRIRPRVVNRYVVSAENGNVLSAQVWGGATLRVYDPSGQVISANGASYWQTVVSYDSGYRPGDYRIDVLGPPGTDYTLELGRVDRERSEP